MQNLLTKSAIFSDRIKNMKNAFVESIQVGIHRSLETLYTIYEPSSVGKMYIILCSFCRHNLINYYDIEWRRNKICTYTVKCINCKLKSRNKTDRKSRRRVSSRSRRCHGNRFRQRISAVARFFLREGGKILIYQGRSSFE